MPQALWVVDPKRNVRRTGSIWLDMVQNDRFTYYIPVVAEGRVVATLTSHLYAGVWRAWPSMDPGEIPEDARTELDAFFGDTDYEWRYVGGYGGIWVIAREGSKEAGILIDAMGCDVEAEAPTGLQTDEALRSWLRSSGDGTQPQ